jgi:DNA-damage-inducible protein J
LKGSISIEPFFMPRRECRTDWHDQKTIRHENGNMRYNVSQEAAMATTTMVHVRVNGKIKEKAAATLAEMGMSVSDAVRMMLVRVAAEKALPFEVRVPNAATVKAMQAADKRKGKRFRSARELFKDLDI